MTLTAQDRIIPTLPADDTDAVEQRGGNRVAMFVSAACIAAGQVQPVRIRNMSRGGALLEGTVLPPEGSEFDLVRGSLTVRARSMWTRGNQCGAALLAPVDVQSWMAKALPAHQQQVDAMAHQARLAMAAGKRITDGPSSEQPSQGANVRAAILLLEELESLLSDDALVIARHLNGLQSLDRALQLLRLAAGQAA